jgi:YegS/Rv2252/BmrU family lipid kinase
MLAVVVNPAAAGGRTGRALPAMSAALRSHGLAYRIELARGIAHARELALTAAGRGESVVAFGGDGLVGALAGALSGSGATLGILPGGRGNDFARVLGIPSSLAGAVAVLAAGQVRTIDLGLAGEKSFAGIASAGLDSEVNRIANDSRLPLDNAIYAYALLRALPAWRPARFTLAIDGAPAREHVGYSVAAANSTTFGGGMRLAPDASLQDGLLDLVLIAHMPRARYLRLAPTVFSGTHVRHPEVELLRFRELELSADRPFALYADGEALAQLPVRVRVQPQALRVLARAQAR